MRPRYDKHGPIDVRDILVRLKEQAEHYSDGHGPLHGEAATEILQLREIAKLFALMLNEIDEEAQAEGLDDRTLDLWSVGKCIGGPTVTLGTSTPRTCAALLTHRKATKRQLLLPPSHSSASEPETA